MSTANVERFEQWIRSDFVQINTELENLYFSQERRENVVGIGESLKQQLHDDGNNLVKALLKEGNTDEGYDNGYNLLGKINRTCRTCSLKRYEF